ncbi:MAG: hypothetical protein LBF86_00250 [Helicobacteraceae bacterium]|jgi:fructose-1,6-bisphosphatase|nr:hypothetical protein [Helicobacteraceae bacterium]
MIAKQLRTANDTLEKLIAITESDLSDIKEAKHDELFNRAKAKEDLVASFQTQKTLLDQAILKVAANNPSADLSSVITLEERDLLEKLKRSLVDLHKLNKRLVSLVLTIGEFYSSLLRAILPSEQNGYDGVKLANAGFLETRG